MAASSIVCLRPYMLELWNGLMAIPTIHLRYECNGSGKRLAITGFSLRRYCLGAVRSLSSYCFFARKSLIEAKPTVPAPAC